MRQTGLQEGGTRRGRVGEKKGRFGEGKPTPLVESVSEYGKNEEGDTYARGADKKEEVISFGSYNIWNRRNGGLDPALCRMD